MSIAERIRLVRGKLSRAEFARRLEINVATVRNYEEGHSLPNSDTIARLCGVFSLKTDWLVLGEGEMLHLSSEEDEAPPFIVDPSEYHHDELEALRGENRELRLENRELRQENRQLLKENGDLRVALARLEARGAPREGAIDGQADEAARKSA
ncbi:MAG: helix-turn-helix domain-containing protein [Thermodesulfobacteriota bacterium]